MSHGEAGVEPLARGAAGAAELPRDEDVEQPFGHHPIEARSEAALLVAAALARMKSSSSEDGSKLRPGATTVRRRASFELGAVVKCMVGPLVETLGSGRQAS